MGLRYEDFMPDPWMIPAGEPDEEQCDAETVYVASAAAALAYTRADPQSGPGGPDIPPDPAITRAALDCSLADLADSLESAAVALIEALESARRARATLSQIDGDRSLP